MNDYISRSEAIRAIAEYPGPVDKSVVRRILTQMEPKTAQSGSGTCMNGEKMHDRTTSGFSANEQPKTAQNVPNGDLISRKAAYETLTAYYHHRTDIQHEALRDALSRVPDTPPEIIRCGECCHYPGEQTDCPMIGWGRCGDDYCSKAERREE